MKAFKGFDKDMKCRDYQYEVGKTFETDKAKLCESGFHACEYPLSVFGYYNPANSRFAEVEIEGDTGEREKDTKLCGTKITVKAEIALPGIISAAVEFIKERVDWKNAKETNTGDWSAATVEGKESVAIATGYESKARGAMGCWLVVAEWDDEAEHIIAVKSHVVDGESIKADTFYQLKGGEFVEA